MHGTVTQDTSDYPDSHNFFCYSTNDGHVPAQISDVVETVYEQKARTIEDIMKWLLNSFAKRLLPNSKRETPDDSDDAMEVSDDDAELESRAGTISDASSSFDDHDDDGDDFGFITSSTHAQVNNSVLHR